MVRQKSALVGKPNITDGTRHVGIEEEPKTMFVARKLMKATLLTAYFGLFALLMVAAGDFVLHG